MSGKFFQLSKNSETYIGWYINHQFLLKQNDDIISGITEH